MPAPAEYTLTEGVAAMVSMLYSEGPLFTVEIADRIGWLPNRVYHTLYRISRVTPIVLVAGEWQVICKNSLDEFENSSQIVSG